MIRVLQNNSGIITVTFEVDDVATDPLPDTATVTLTRADGTVVATNQSTTATGVGTFSYTLTPTQTALLDTLTATWTATIASTVRVVTTRVEIVGGHLFTLSEARLHNPLNDTTTYPTDKLRRYRALAEQSLEDLCGVAFVPRYSYEKIERGTGVITTRPRVRTLRSISIDGIEQTDLDPYTFEGYGAIHSTTGWGTNSVVWVGYEHGYTEPPLRVSQAAIILAKNWIVQGPLDDRITALQTQDGTFPMMTPGMRGALTEIPEVEAVIQIYGYPQGVA